MNNLEGEFGSSNVTHVPDRLPMAPGPPPPGNAPKYIATGGGYRPKKKKKQSSGRRSSKLAMNYGNILNSLEGEFGTSNVTHIASGPQGMGPPPPSSMGAAPKYIAPLGGVKKKALGKKRMSLQLAGKYSNILNSLEGEFGTSNVVHLPEAPNMMGPPPPGPAPCATRANAPKKPKKKSGGVKRRMSSNLS